MAELDYTPVTNEVESDFVAIPVPVGEYVVVMSESDVKDVKEAYQGQIGKHLDIFWQVIEGRFKGEKIFELINYICPKSQKAEQIAHRTLNSIKMAIFGDLREVKETALMHNIPIKLVVAAKKNKDTDEIELYIKKHLPYGNGNNSPQPAMPATTETAATGTVPTVTPGKKQNPWEI